MRKLGHVALGAGFIALGLCAVSRLLMEPVYGIEAHAIIEYAQGLLLLAIALYIGDELKH